MKKRCFTILLLSMSVIVGSGTAAAAQEAEVGVEGITVEVAPVLDAENGVEGSETEAPEFVADSGATAESEKFLSEPKQSVKSVGDEIIIDDVLADGTSSDETESESETGTVEDFSIDLLESEINAEPADTKANAFSGSGDGTETNPYRITTAQQMDEVRYDLEACYVLENDIDLSDYENWMPISSYEGDYNLFEGVFDGNNKTISGLHISQNESDAVGLFGMSYGTIKNVNLKDVDIKIELKYNEYSSSDIIYIGAVVGQAVSVTGCTVTGNISVSGSQDTVSEKEVNIGGIAGCGNVDHCVNRANINVTGVNKVLCGGLSGSTSPVGGELTSECDNYGNISAVSFGSSVGCGGIYGKLSTTNLTKCRNYGKIYGETQKSGEEWNTYTDVGCYAGGIVGKIDLLCLQFTKAVNYGNVESSAQNGGDSYAGGIVGYSEDVWGYDYLNKIHSCFNMCDSVKAESKGGNTAAGKASAFRITSYCPAVTIETCYSLNTTLCNGSLPTAYIGPDQLNGGSLSMEEISNLIDGSGKETVGNETVLHMYPENGESDINPEDEYDITVLFDGTVKANEGSVKLVDLNTGNIQYYDVNDIKIENTRVTISGVQLDYDKKYRIQFEEGCISIDDVPFFGFSGENDWVFQTITKTHTDHSWNSGTVTKEADCTKSGIKTYTCTVCGETRSEDIPATGHTWDSGEITKKPTGTKKGVKTYTCTRCGKTKTETIPATGQDTVKLKTPKLLKVISKKSKTMTVKWSKVKNAGNYKIQCSPQKNFNAVKMKYPGSKKKSVDFLNLKSGKTYYVRVQAYKEVNGKTYYSDWSKVKSVKIK